MTKIITVMNLKGGSGKTTTTAHLAHAYAARGLNVVIIDADPQQSLMRWSSQADWELPVMGKPVPKLYRLLHGMIGDRFDVALIDTPPLDEKAGIVYGALRASDTVIVPLQPTMLEIERLPDVWHAIDEASDLRNDDITAAVLFNRTITNASSTAIHRSTVEDSGHRVLQTTIPRREAIAQAGGAQIVDLYGHDLVADELEQKEQN
jgi:chromosome partitioning protein